MTQKVQNKNSLQEYMKMIRVVDVIKFKREELLSVMDRTIQELKRERFVFFDGSFLENYNSLQNQFLNKNEVIFEIEMEFNGLRWNTRKSEKEFRDFCSKIKEIDKKKIQQVDEDIVKNIIVQIFQNSNLHKDFGFIHFFLEISIFNFIGTDATIYKQGYFQKKTGGSKNNGKSFCQNLVGFKDRWFIITNKGIGYLQKNQWKIDSFREYMDYQKDFQMRFDVSSKRVEFQFGNIFYKVRTHDRSSLFDLVFSLFIGLSEEINWYRNYRYMSFCQIYQETKVDLFINGYQENYYNILCERLLLAEKEILIQDWWFCPQLYLKRPWRQNEHHRLDRVLKQLADKGVKIYIILYNEIGNTLYTNSEYVIKYMMKLSPNINVINHPNFLVHLWSHHEKMVIIDSKEVFMGGLDLCFGRYEVEGYPLTDNNEEFEIWRGIDYANELQVGFTDVDQYENSLLDRKNQPRMPWRDITAHMQGQISIGMRDHFIQLWNYNNIQKDNNNAFGNFVKINLSQVNVDSEIKKHCTSHQPRNSRCSNLSEIKQGFMKRENAIEDIEKERKNYSKTDSHFSAQGLRSASYWSIGLTGLPEHSIMTAYLDLIDKAEHYIYIENQFFISSTGGDLVKNEIVDKLAKKIVSKIKKNEKFQVFIVIPLLASFAGDITTSEGQMLRVQLSWHLKTIERSQNSIIKQIQRVDKDWRKYLKILGLRNHTLLNEKPITEIIYVHSKMMIVDDKYIVLGSANLNDRSMLGSRDSELAVILEDQNLITGKLNQREVQKSEKIKNFRENIFKSLFGLQEQDDDFLDEQSLNELEKIADFNEDFYYQVFRAYPSNNFPTLDSIRKAKEFQSDRDYYLNNRELVKGYVVNYPVYFLKDEKEIEQLKLLGITDLAPDHMFTQLIINLVIKIVNEKHQ